jgi:tetratricopeptide (TPR) repeat protein
MTTQDKRARRIAATAFLVVSLACTQVPLLNYLGFEYSALIALVATLVSGLMHLSFASRLDRGASYLPFVGRSFASSCLLLGIPVGISVLNALIVRNCSFTQGFVFFALLVLPAVFFSVSLATAITVLTDRWRKTWFVVIVVAVLLQVLVVTVTRPQIFAFNYILGFFPGITYDETLRVEPRLLLFRLETILAALLMLGIARIIDARRRRPVFGPLSAEGVVRRALYRRWLVTTVVVAVGWGWMMLSSEGLGFSSSAESIARTLGGRIEGDHIVMVYPKASLSPNEAQRLLDLHEFLFQELCRDLGVAPQRKITSFLYPSPYEKGLLVGAAGTNIAKPWLWQLHVNLGDVDAVLKHELVHVMAAEFGFVLFRVGLNPGLIEGLAMAVERTAYGETLHRLARCADTLGIPSDLKGLFSISGFVRAPASVSYTLAGSFSRYLIDRYGMRRFKRLYRTGDFEDVYRKSLDQLQSEWRAMIRSIAPSPDELEKATYLFARPSIFTKVCARVIADLNDRTRELLAKGLPDSALELSDRSLSLTETPDAVMLHASALFRLGRYEDVTTFAGERLTDSTLRRHLLPLHRTAGTAEWALGRREQARSHFEILKRTRISTAWSEDAALRLQCLNENNPSVLLPYFTGAVPDSVAVGFLRDLLPRDAAGSSTLRYMLGIVYDRQGARDSALMEFSRARFRDSVLEFSRIRRLALVEFALGKYESAKVHFWEARNRAPAAALELELDEWMRRCDWMEEKVQTDPYTRTRQRISPESGKLIFAQNFRLFASHSLLT